jgi:protein-L-isoaspartate(D-aspartate) O-methyltransferase
MAAVKMDMEQARFNMIEQQIRPWEVLDPEVLGILAVVKREDFVPDALKALAFADLELPIGNGQTMLQPKIEARILQEVGSGTPISCSKSVPAAATWPPSWPKAEYVYSVEIDPQLAENARHTLRRTGVANVSVETGDASQGWPVHAPYDVIVISGSLPELPEAFLQQLKIGGRLAAFIGEPPVMDARLIIRTDEQAFNTINLFETVVAALTSQEASELRLLTPARPCDCRSFSPRRGASRMGMRRRPAAGLSRCPELRRAVRGGARAPPKPDARKQPQALAGLLPTIAATGNTFWNDTSYTVRNRASRQTRTRTSTTATPMGST